jgi:tetratricopeptide (TPR) repeat protein
MMIRRACGGAAFLVAAVASVMADDTTTCKSVLARSPEAIAACTRIIASGNAKGRSLAQAYYGRGQKYRLKGNSDKAILDFSSAIRIDPGWHFPYVARGHAYAAKRQFTLAFADQETAIRLEPTEVSYVGRAQDLMAAGETDRAIADCEQAIRLNPNYFYAFFNRAHAYLEKHQFEKALSDYRRAQEIGSDEEDMKEVRQGINAATSGGWSSSLSLSHPAD